MEAAGKILTIGTGTGQAVLLRGLRQRGLRPRAVVGVTDNGGSSASVRRSLHLPQPGDTRQCLTALAAPGLWRDLFAHRFREGELRGVSLGNLILAALAQQSGSFEEATSKAAELLKLSGDVVPVSNADTQICARMEDGTRIVGEWEIIRRAPQTPIESMELSDPRAEISDAALAALREAELVVLGPGTLRTGVVACLLFAGMREAVARSSARFAYVCNIMSQPGQTDGFSASDHVDEIERYLGRPLDDILLNQTPIPGPLVRHYAQIGAHPVEDDLGNRRGVLRLSCLQPTSLKILDEHTRPDNVFLLRHDPDRLAAAIERIWREPSTPEPSPE